MIPDIICSIVSAVGGLLSFFGILDYVSGGGGLLVIFGTLLMAMGEGAKVLLFRRKGPEEMGRELKNFTENIGGRFAYPVLALALYLILGSTVLLAFAAVIAIDAVLKTSALVAKRMLAENEQE